MMLSAWHTACNMSNNSRPIELCRQSMFLLTASSEGLAGVLLTLLTRSHLKAVSECYAMTGTGCY